jgi:hypothetical protein
MGERAIDRFQIATASLAQSGMSARLSEIDCWMIAAILTSMVLEAKIRQFCIECRILFLLLFVNTAYNFGHVPPNIMFR